MCLAGAMVRILTKDNNLNFVKRSLVKGIKNERARGINNYTGLLFGFEEIYQFAKIIFVKFFF